MRKAGQHTMGWPFLSGLNGAKSEWCKVEWCKRRGAAKQEIRSVTGRKWVAIIPVLGRPFADVNTRLVILP